MTGPSRTFDRPPNDAGGAGPAAGPQLAAFDRRGFVKRGLLGGILLASAGGLSLALWPSGVGPVVRQPLRVLDQRTFGIMAAIAGRVVTAPNADPVEIAHRI